MEVVLSANEKGGCAKTATVLLLGNCLSALGYRVLVVDMDPSGNLSQAALKVIPDKVLYDVLSLTEGVYETIVKSDAFDILPTKKDNTQATTPASIAKTGFPTRVPKNRKSLNQFFASLQGNPHWEVYLASLLHTTGLEEHYDFILLDSPPSDGPIITNCIHACNTVIIPCVPSRASLDGLKMFVTSVLDTNPKAQLDGLVLSMFKENDRKTRKESLQIILDLAQSENMYIYNTRIRDSSAVETSMNDSRPILDYMNMGNGAEDAMNFALEFLHRRGLNPKKQMPGMLLDENGMYVFRKNGSKFYSPDIHPDGSVHINELSFHRDLCEDSAWLETVGRTAFLHEASIYKRYPNAAPAAKEQA